MPRATRYRAWKVFWQTFGASNQLLASLALVGMTIWLLNTAKNKKAWIYTFVPAVVMFIMSTWALTRMFITNTVVDGVFKFPAGANIIVPIACLIYLVLAVWMVVVTIQAVVKRGGRMEAPKPTPISAD